MLRELSPFLFLVAASCAAVGPDYETPAVTLPESFASAGGTAAPRASVRTRPM